MPTNMLRHINQGFCAADAGRGRAQRPGAPGAHKGRPGWPPTGRAATRGPAQWGRGGVTLGGARASKLCTVPSIPRALMEYISLFSSVLIVPITSMPDTASMSAGFIVAERKDGGKNLGQAAAAARRKLGLAPPAVSCAQTPDLARGLAPRCGLRPSRRGCKARLGRV